ncbi:prepilin-type N-terminal cleavage/methylation domain-containing protein [Candidatus Uhrbacteria bacterium]|nr:prepilin-type N-terminal cleavage/methylation domain-containing protein [Candidatus Uhrbacteria bacterium]
MKSSAPSKQRKGFTIVEVLISISILSMLFAIGATGASRMSKRLLIGPSDAYLENILTTASRRARDGVEGGSWGVYLPYDEETRNLSEVVVFKGSSYATRDSAFDQVFPYANKTDFITVDFSGAGVDTTNDHEVIFMLYSGQTSQYGSVDLEVFGVARTVRISPEGFITREL